jgi:hypothetical protein
MLEGSVGGCCRQCIQNNNRWLWEALYSHFVSLLEKTAMTPADIGHHFGPLLISQQSLYASKVRVKQIKLLSSGSKT